MAKVKAACPNCQKTFLVAAEVIGKKAKCAGCQKPFVLSPIARPTNSSAKQQQKGIAQPSASKTDGGFPIGSQAHGASDQLGSPKQQMLNASTKIKKLQPLLANKSINTGRVSILYRINILFTTLVMLLLPVVYVCLIALVCYLVFYHATHNGGMMGMVRGRGVIFMGILFVAPIVGGVVLVFFMFKPLLAKPGRSQRKRKVNAKGEPVLFWFVERICKIVGSPVPRQIYITHDINAAASFEHGMRSAIAGRNLSLHVGVPLVGGTTLQQFGGVLAHEFGHFSQGAGMRLSLFIRSVNHWFARVVYERDAWDEALASLIDEDTDFRLALIVLFVQFCVFVSRGILWLLMMVGHTVSCSLLRQMEFDADKYEIQFAGSENFEQTSDRLQVLNASYGKMIPSIVNAALQQKTVKDLPKSILEKTKGLEPMMVQEILKLSHGRKTGLLDTHPSDAQRIEKAREASAEGVFHCTAPASILFSNYQMTSESITDDFYRNEFGVTKQMIRDQPKRKRRR